MMRNANTTTRSLSAALALTVGGVLAPAPARAAHPLITEDAYTLGRGVAQLEIGFERARFNQDEVEGRVYDVRPVISYGLRDDVDLMLGAPYLDTRELSAAGVERTRGFADASLEVKWRFWDGELAKAALKPGLTFPTGEFREGLGTGRTAPSIFLVSTFEREAWTWNLHVGYVRNENRVDERRDLLHLSGSVVYRMNPQLQWALDLSADSNLDRNSQTFPSVALLAAIYSPTEDIDLDLGVKVGLNSAADASAVLAGVTLRW
jgi:hypothetical protein